MDTISHTIASPRLSPPDSGVRFPPRGRAWKSHQHLRQPQAVSSGTWKVLFEDWVAQPGQGGPQSPRPCDTGETPTASSSSKLPRSRTALGPRIQPEVRPGLFRGLLPTKGRGVKGQLSCEPQEGAQPVTSLSWRCENGDLLPAGFLASSLGLGEIQRHLREAPAQ